MIELYLQHEYLVASLQLTLAMLGMGATVTPRDFVQVFRMPKGIVLGSIMQVILVPVIAWLFIQGFTLEAGVAIGIALCAAIPGGTTSNIFTFLAGGNVPLSVSMTTLSTLACLLTTPIILAVLATVHMPADFAMPSARIARDVFLFLLLPLAAGMVYFRLYPGTADLFSKWCIRTSIAVIGLIVVGSIGAGRLDLEAYGLDNAALVFLFIIALSVFGIFMPKLFRMGSADVTAINMEVTIRNANLALLIKTSMFPALAGAVDQVGNTVLLTVLLFGSYQLILSIPLIYLGRLRRKRQALPV